MGAHILSGILVRATGETVRDFAANHLFEPLGIQVPESRTVQTKEAYMEFIKEKDVSGWIVDNAGVHTAGWGLALRPLDMAKIGQLYLNKGKWNGNKIISSNWITKSTKVYSGTGGWLYGYLWWILSDHPSSDYAALGDGGNAIYVSPHNETVVAIASSFKPKPKDRVEFINKYILSGC